MRVEVTVGHDIVATTRMRQMSAMFDAPLSDKMARTWSGDVPIEERDWQIGAIVGPSGCGKSTVARHLFGEPIAPSWSPTASIVDSFGDMSIDRITDALSSVGFNTIPAWMRPHGTLSNGERFRCDLARILVDERPRVWVDEFTSVVDRQVARVGSHAVARFVRRTPGRQLVVASCHHDIVDWLQPDWTLEPATMTFTWRSVQPRPRIDGYIARTPWATWRLFAPYHYLTADLHRAARCYAVHVDDRPVGFGAVLHVPISNGPDRGETIIRLSRLVVLPDWQGIGIAFRLADTLGAAYAAIGKRFRCYPAHPPLIRAYRSKPHLWEETEGSTKFHRRGADDGRKAATIAAVPRPCGRFEYVGPSMDVRAARRLLALG